MKLRPLGANKTELSLENGTLVFFSYETPVAAIINGENYRTDKHWSATTSKHITQWLHGANAQMRPQAFFDRLTA